MSRTVEELERALAAAERKASELQAWADASDAEAEQLRARVAELETARHDAPAAAPPKEDPRVAELQAWVDSAEKEAETLRARVAELEAAKPPAAAPPKEDPRVAELQAWVDSAEQEAETLRARITELETHPPQREDPRVAELQAWMEAAEKETEDLRARTRAAEKEAEVARERLSLLGGSVGEGAHLATENRELVARLGELEALNHSLRQLNDELAARVAAAAKRDKERLEAQLAEARAQGAEARVHELEDALEHANEAVATLEVQHEAAVEQVKRYVAADTSQQERALRELETQHRKALLELERNVATLEAQLAEKTDEASVLHVRLKAHEGEEQRLLAELSTQRERACTAESSLSALRANHEELLTAKGAADARLVDLEHKLDEAKRWLAQGELENSELEKQLEAVKTERAVLQMNAHAPAPEAAPPPPAAAAPTGPPPPPADALEEDLEGFSAQRLHRLEALLAAEQLRTAALQRFAETAEASLRRLQEELQAAQGRLADMTKRLGLSESETGETLDRLDAARRELHALFGELARARQPVAPGAPAAEEAEELSPEDVLEAPLNALEQLAQQQATAAKEATEALASEQRAREQLMHDLSWLKAELEKLSNVREDLKQRLAAMVQRELKCKQVVAQLLEKLRHTEVAAAARAGTLRRLQAAMELAQRTAVKVQTVYFQKQIGSLQRQLENALGHRSPAARLGRR